MFSRKPLGKDYFLYGLLTGPKGYLTDRPPTLFLPGLNVWPFFWYEWPALPYLINLNSPITS